MPSKPRDLVKVRNQLDQLAWLMDQCFRIPGLNWRFGLEALIGLVPGAGDMLTGMIGLFLLFRAMQFKLPKIVVVRMILNTLLDIGIGAIPFLGDLFDFIWKSNTRNMKLFRKYAQEPQRSTKQHWIFLASILVLFGGIFLFLGWLTIQIFAFIVNWYAGGGRPSI